MFKFLDNIQLSTLIGFSVLMLLLPFRPMPHVLEKVIMLIYGELIRGLDIFDLFYHFIPSILLVVKVVRMISRNNSV